ncbi:MAG: prolipoprotein diacylglyceryl transferase [Actinobacteria bacterium]|nr:prolipoprotein diacylglyceryl transferase [Actinomycetota bacterium]
MNFVGSIPSPESGVWDLGPVPVRAYALCILLGIVVGVWLGNKRWVQRGGAAGFVTDAAIWVVPFGIVGARLYHVATDFPTYFGANGLGLIDALKIWQGGLGIWGAVAGGALGAWIACRRAGVLLPPLADAVAPGIAIAQGIGRWGNWFNQELFGRPTDVPWALQIDLVNRPVGFEQFETFHPTFLYESIWVFLVALFVIWADRRFQLGHGRVFALYVLAYCVGRLFFELVRIDTATLIFGVRINVFTSVLVGLAALIGFVISARLHPGREPSVYRESRDGGNVLQTDSDSQVDPTINGDTGIDGSEPEKRN